MGSPLFFPNLFKTATGTLVSSKRALDVYIQGGSVGGNAGRSVLAKARIDYSSASVGTGAYTTLIADVGASDVEEIEIFDSSGQTLVLAFGAAASEVDQMYILPGGNGRISLHIPAGTRVSVKAVSGTANSGELSVNFYG